MFGGKIIDGKIVYRENSETYPEKDGFMEHESKEVIEFFMKEKLFNGECYRFMNGMQDTLFGGKVPNNSKFSFTYNKERPSQLCIITGENEKYDTLLECLTEGKAERRKYWDEFIDNEYEKKGKCSLSDADETIAFELTLWAMGESHLQDESRN